MPPSQRPKTTSPFFKGLVYILLLTFNLTSVAPFPSLYAQEMPFLPPAGLMVHLSPTMTPPILKGIQIYPDNPLKFGFIIDRGTVDFSDLERQKETLKMAKYFLTSMAIPEEDMWVNLSPYEGDRMVDEDLGQTELGRDMLAQDYLLKQLTASLIYPQENLGKDFWDKVYKKVYEEFGTTRLPVNTFNKVWIVTDRAEVYENKNTAFVIDHHLKVMLEEDYLALQKNIDHKAIAAPELGEQKVKDISSVASQIVREIIIPALEKEVNEGENFSAIRQIYNAHILAVWYKKALKESLLGRVYVNQNKIQGVDLEDKTIKEKIYNQYIEAFPKGAFNFIKEDYDENTKAHIKRRYFSGGVTLTDEAAIHFVDDAALLAMPPLATKFQEATTIRRFDLAEVEASELNRDDAMLVQEVRINDKTVDVTPDKLGIRTAVQGFKDATPQVQAAILAFLLMKDGIIRFIFQKEGYISYWSSRGIGKVNQSEREFLDSLRDDMIGKTGNQPKTFTLMNGVLLSQQAVDIPHDLPGFNISVSEQITYIGGKDIGFAWERGPAARLGPVYRADYGKPKPRVRVVLVKPEFLNNKITQNKIPLVGNFGSQVAVQYVILLPDAAMVQTKEGNLAFTTPETLDGASILSAKAMARGYEDVGAVPSGNPDTNIQRILNQGMLPILSLRQATRARKVASNSVTIDFAAVTTAEESALPGVTSKLSGDKAFIDEMTPRRHGGIDLKNVQDKLIIKRGPNWEPLPVEMQDIPYLQERLKGLTPILLQQYPLPNVIPLLGLKEGEMQRLGRLN